MGIKNLKIILNTYCKCAINKRKLIDYSGMTIAIDVSIYLYKYLYNNNDHLEGLTRFCLRLLKNNITPLFVFDGAPPQEKNEILQSRRDKRTSYVNKKLELNNILSQRDMIEKGLEIQEPIIEEENVTQMSNIDIKKEIDKLEKKIIFVKGSHIESSKKLFDLFGVKYVVANGEAEQLCAQLCKSNIVDGCISEDTDILANGGQLFLINFNADNNSIEEYCLYGILNCLEIDYTQFIDMCILCGCDYTSKIMGMGPLTSYKMIKKYKKIETILEEIKKTNKYTIPDNFDYIKARELFVINPNEELCNLLKDQVLINKPNLVDLSQFLKNNSAAIKTRYITEINNNINKYYNSITNISSKDKNKGSSESVELLSI
jgi:flap endonuclease-1